MRQLALSLVAFILVMRLATSAWARGCVVEGTLIDTPAGSVLIEKLHVGDPVWAVVGGKRISATVQDTFKATTQSILTFHAGRHTLRVTPDHPVEVVRDTFESASMLTVGHDIVVYDEEGFHCVPIDRIERAEESARAYNILVLPGGTFIAGGVVVHNKGCFLPETPVELANGKSKSIDQVIPGDALLAFTPEGHVLTSTVERVLKAHVDGYLKVQTESKTLSVTPDHPFYVGRGTFQTIGALHVGDCIYILRGGSLVQEHITGMEQVVTPTTVYNLQTEDPNTFFADGVAVHNKGCFPEGTLISTPTGSQPIEQLQVGQHVISIDDNGEVVTARVLALHQQDDFVWTLCTKYGLLRTTADHPLRLWDGEFASAEDVTLGASVTYWDHGRCRAAKVMGIGQAALGTRVYNLTVESPHTFLADGFVVHNKGGCVAARTPVLMWNSRSVVAVSIEQVRPGDIVTAVDGSGNLVPAAVTAIYAERGTILEIRTDEAMLCVTPEHPVAMSAGVFVTADKLRIGERMLVFNGLSTTYAAIRQILPRDVEQVVYNLSVDGPHTFIASGIVVHNKGGFGGFGGHSSSGSSTQPWQADDWLEVIVIFAFVAWAAGLSLWKAGRGGTEDLDYLFARREIDPKVQRTRVLADYLAKDDPLFNLEKIQEVTKHAFPLLEQCWENRDYAPMEHYLTPDLFAQHSELLRQMIDHHEINRIEGLQIRAVDVVNLQYSKSPNKCHLTVLITASARDYYIDDRTHAFRRGNKTASSFQEFWVFQRAGDTWLLADIEQSRESDSLKRENIIEGWAPAQLAAFYKTGNPIISSELDLATSSPAPIGSRLDVALAVLSDSNPQWDRQNVLSRGRTLYIALISARQAEDPRLIDQQSFVAALFEKLSSECLERKQAHMRVEYRNFCVRRSEIVTIHPTENPAGPECMIRMIAHAQIVRMSNENVLFEDAYEKAFEEYVTLLLTPEGWRLAEVSK